MTELKPINRKQSIPEMMQDIKTQGWIFEKPIEKIIITASVLWSVFSLVKFLIGIFI